MLRAQVLGFRVRDSGRRIQGLDLRVQSSQQASTLTACCTEVSQPSAQRSCTDAHSNFIDSGLVGWNGFLHSRTKKESKKNLWSRVYGFRFGEQGSGLGFKVWGFRFGAWVSGIRA